MVYAREVHLVHPVVEGVRIGVIHANEARIVRLVLAAELVRVALVPEARLLVFTFIGWHEL